MRKNLGIVLCVCGLLAFVAASIFAVVTPAGPGNTGAAAVGTGSDGSICRWTSYYGNAQIANATFMYENETGLGLNNTTPANMLDVDGKCSIGEGAGTANGAVQLLVRPLNASTTGQIINAAASSTADVLQIQADGTNVIQINASGTTASQPVLSITIPNTNSTGTVVNAQASASADMSHWQVNGSTAIIISETGHLRLRRYTKLQIDTLTPGDVGDIIQCSNCTITYQLCVASGSAVAQWAAGTTASRGCGSNN